MQFNILAQMSSIVKPFLKKFQNISSFFIFLTKKVKFIQKTQIKRKYKKKIIFFKKTLAK